MARNGMIVKDAATAGAHLDLAEPDALDFNLLGNTRYGVLSGCDVAITGWNVTVSSGVVVNNGTILQTGGSITLPTASQDARFDLIGVDASGGIAYIRGNASPNPVFPDFGENVVILASIMVRPGVAPPAMSDITDKRIVLPQRFMTALSGGVLLGSHNPANLVPKFTIEHDGRTTWGTDVSAYRTAVGKLRLDNGLITGSVEVDLLTVNDNLDVDGVITARNLRRGAGPPSGTAQPGDLYQNTTSGGLWVWETSWVKLSTVPIPAGLMSMSMRSDEPSGWLFLNGQLVEEARAGGLWALYPQWITTTPEGQRLRLPNYNGLFLRQGTPGDLGGNSTLTLTKNHLPPHKHLDPSTGGMSPADPHTHVATVSEEGEHGHTTSPDQGVHGHAVIDALHDHRDANGGAGGAFVIAMWGGPFRLDGPFNDASHPLAAGTANLTNPAYSGVRVQDGGAHAHWTDQKGRHKHVVTLGPGGSPHVHPINEQSVGQGQPIDLTPPYGSVRYLIKT